jgi:hypothetical protein
MPETGPCFSYPPDVVLGVRQMSTGTACFRYRPEVPRTMPNMCFSYPPATPAARRDLRQMPYPCYSYPDDEPRGGGDPGAAQPPSPALRRMPYTCFRY